MVQLSMCMQLLFVQNASSGSAPFASDSSSLCRMNDDGCDDDDNYNDNEERTMKKMIGTCSNKVSLLDKAETV